jgi:hypothetical protein
MSRRLTLVVLATAVTFASGAAHAQFKGWGDNDNRDKKTGRTEDGVKADAEVDKLYRAKAGQHTPQVRADPWSDVRAPSTPAAQPAGKAKQKQP